MPGSGNRLPGSRVCRQALQPLRPLWRHSNRIPIPLRPGSSRRSPKPCQYLVTHRTTRHEPVTLLFPETGNKRNGATTQGRKGNPDWLGRTIFPSHFGCLFHKFSLWPSDFSLSAKTLLNIGRNASRGPVCQVCFNDFYAFAKKKVPNMSGRTPLTQGPRPNNLYKFLLFGSFLVLTLLSLFLENHIYVELFQSEPASQA